MLLYVSLLYVHVLLCLRRFFYSLYFHIYSYMYQPNMQFAEMKKMCFEPIVCFLYWPAGGGGERAANERSAGGGGR